MEFEVTKMGERGQVVIPLEFRKNMHLQKGQKFMVMEKRDSLVLKKLKSPTLKDEFDELLRKSHAHAKKHKLTEKDMWEAIRKVRGQK